LVGSIGTHAEWNAKRLGWSGYEAEAARGEPLPSPRALRR
jgi:hypothetical protein